MIYFDMCIAQKMFIEPAGIEDVAAMWAPCAAMGYYHVPIQALLRNRFAAFEALHAGNKRQIWHQFLYIRADIKQYYGLAGCNMIVHLHLISNNYFKLYLHM